MFGIDDAAMGMMGSAAIGAGTSILGGVMGQSGQAATNAQQMAMFQQQMAFNHQEAWDARIWNKEMAETAYQRTMTDMKKAGLNPILAANLGGAIPAGSPQAAAPGAPGLGNPGSAMQAGITGAGDAMGKAALWKTAMAQADKDASTVKVNEKQEANIEAMTSKTKQDERTSKSAEGLNIATTLNKATEQLLMEAQGGNQSAQARLAGASAEQIEKYGASPYGQALGTLMKSISTLIDAHGTNAQKPYQSTDPRSSGDKPWSVRIGDWLRR